MRLAVSAQGEGLDSSVDQRFGRAPWFVIVDTNGGAGEAIRNEQNLEAAQGAGIQAAQTIANRNVDAVVTGHCGPKAFRILTAAGVGVYLGAQGSVSNAVEQFRKRQLTKAEQADVEGH